MAQIYQTISYVAFALAGVSLLLAIVFWLRFHIWNVIGDLSGRNAKKTIEQMRKENEKNAVHRRSGSYYGKRDSGQTTDTSGRKKKSRTQGQTDTGTEPTDDNKTVLLPDVTELMGGETELIGRETEPIGGETGLLGQGTEHMGGGTELLGQGTELMDGETESSKEETMLLSEAGKGFRLKQNIMCIHTQEIME